MGVEAAKEQDSEIFIWRTAKGAEGMRFGGGDGMPVAEVARAIKDYIYSSFVEFTASDYGIDGFEEVGGGEFEGTSEKDCGNGLGRIGFIMPGEGDYVSLLVGGQGFGIGVDGGNNIGIYHSPEL